MQTDFKMFSEAAKTYKTIPIVKKYKTDLLTPVKIFQSLEADAVYLLESNEAQSQWSNFSFVGLKPFLTLVEQNGDILLKDAEGYEVYRSDKLKEVFSFIQEKMAVMVPNLDIPFTGGAVGALSYEFISLTEPVSCKENQKAKCMLYICETIAAFNHKQNELTFIHYVPLSGGESIEELRTLYDIGVRKVEKYTRRLLSSPQLESLILPSVSRGKVDMSHVRSNYQKEEFERDVRNIQEYIKAGDIFQAVLSQRFEVDVTAAGFDLYRVLRAVNPSPYLFYIKFQHEELIGSSPERLVHVHQSRLEIHPIAGTRRRGRDDQDDELLGEELLSDEKEKAEHFMLVDLARNDIGRVAEYGTVQTPVLKELIRFSHVMHLVSKVTGRLREDIHPVEALLSSFPAGTVSGAPKIRAMQILSELETHPRNYYAGCVAYVGFDGNIDSCITIRTIQLKDGVASVQAGAGIVADSVPELEWKETINKASALLHSISIAEETFSKGGETENESFTY
ncbi:anthranilate synthase component I [Bacillus lacus]|uniref:Anthranilate synthase component 1 n=1 Tax=Metabacillus lacus TaxID=1983721 RepID=A0A7X2IWB1_9BACI|nr:anthranilate synthase component I [Metabacillus lacus]MRX70996.1 anthranilate synthase component I [Metabacillus lacus]